MLSPPSSPPRKTRGSEVNIGSNLASMLDTTLTITDRQPHAHGSQDVLPTSFVSATPTFAEISDQVQKVINVSISEWSMIAGDCTFTIAQYIISNRIPLSDLIANDLWLRPETIRQMLVELVQRYKRLRLPVPLVPESDEAMAQHPLSLFIIQTLQGTAYAYLTLVWKNVDNMIQSTDPHVSNDSLFSLIRESSNTPNLSKQILETNTSWHPRYGYSFWHLPETEQIRDHRTLFLNPAVHWMLHQLLVKFDSSSCIITQEVFNHPLDPTRVDAVHPLEYHIVEKIAFALSWMVVQMRCRGLSYYSFESNLVLTPYRVQCVVWEHLLVSSLFHEIMASNDERSGPLYRFFNLIVQPNGH